MAFKNVPMEVPSSAEKVKIPPEKIRQLANREIGGVTFDSAGFVTVNENGDSPFLPGEKLKVHEEYGVGGFVENVIYECSSGFFQSRYDSNLQLPKEFVEFYLPEFIEE